MWCNGLRDNLLQHASSLQQTCIEPPSLISFSLVSGCSTGSVSVMPPAFLAQVLFNFELGNQVYAKARVKPTSKANLWLGADVMLEYPLDEAIALLVRGSIRYSSRTFGR